jgi:hypothetical protein
VVGSTEHANEQCEIRGSDTGVAEESVLLRCGAMSLCKWFLTF